jgi:hypothetical protein
MSVMTHLYGVNIEEITRIPETFYADSPDNRLPK